MHVIECQGTSARSVYMCVHVLVRMLVHTYVNYHLYYWYIVYWYYYVSPFIWYVCEENRVRIFCVPKRFLPPVSTVPTVTPNTNILSQLPTERGQWGQLPRPMLNYT